jgi:hypothetical protein
LRFESYDVHVEECLHDEVCQLHLLCI